MQQSDTVVAESDPATEMPIAVPKTKSPENNNTVILSSDVHQIGQHDQVIFTEYEEEELQKMKDNYKINSEFITSFVQDITDNNKQRIQEPEEITNLEDERRKYESMEEGNNVERFLPYVKVNDENCDDFYYKSLPNSENESDSNSRLKIDLSDDEDDHRNNETNKRRRSSERDKNYLRTKCLRKDSSVEDEEIQSPTFQDNFINSMKISNSQSGEVLYRGEFDFGSPPGVYSNDSRKNDYGGDGNEIPIDVAKFSWHPHVYANPPKALTPHSIVDILGWGIKHTKLNVSSPLRVASSPSPLYSLQNISIGGGSAQANPDKINIKYQEFGKINKTSNAECQTKKQDVLSQLLNVRRKDSLKIKFDSSSELNSCGSVLMQRLEGQGGLVSVKDVSAPPLSSFVSCAPMHCGGLVTAREGPLPMDTSGSCEQPLDLCVSRGRITMELTSPKLVQPQDLSKTSKKESSKPPKRKKSTELPPLIPQSTSGSISSVGAGLPDLVGPGVCEDASRDSSEAEGDPRRKKKARTTFTGRQIFELEKLFEVKKYLSSSERTDMAKLLNVTETQVSPF